MIYYLFSLIIYIIFIPGLGISLASLSYVVWISEIETSTIISKNYELYYVLSKFIFPIYTIWALYSTLKVVYKSFVVFKKKSINKLSSSETIKELQNALDSGFKSK